MLLNKVDLVPGNIKSILYTLHYLESVLYPLALLLFHMCMHIFLFIVLVFWRFLWLILLRTEVHYYGKKSMVDSNPTSFPVTWDEWICFQYCTGIRNEIFVICKLTIMKKFTKDIIQNSLFKNLYIFHLQELPYL